MPYKIAPNPRDPKSKLDLPGDPPTHHRVKMPNQGGVIPAGGIVVTTLDPHYIRQQQRGEVTIEELPKEAPAAPAPAAPAKAREPLASEKNPASPAPKEA